MSDNAELWVNGSNDFDNSRACFHQWALENRKWVQIYLNYGERQSVMDSILLASNNQFKRWKTVIAKFIFYSGLESTCQRYSMCSGHMAFTNWSIFSNNTTFSDDVCSICLSQAPEGPVKGPNVYWYIPLKPRIAAMLLNETCCTQLYSYKFYSNPGIFQDFFDGKCFERIISIYGDLESLKNDIFIAISTDGFQPFSDTEENVWPVLAIVLNLHPSQRYRIANIIPLGFAPGPSPSNLQSLLAPLINELKEDFGEEGALLKYFDGVYRRVRVHVVWVLGDLPVIAKLAGTLGHNAKLPCRFCNLNGVWSPTKKHYYYPSRIMQDDQSHLTIYDICSPPLRSLADINRIFNELAVVNGTHLATIRTSTGIKEKSILFSLPTLQPFMSFPIDSMHLLYNISRQLLSIFVDGFHDCFRLSDRQISYIDSQLVNFSKGFSSSIAPRPRKLQKYKSWKAAEHKQFVLRYSAIVFRGMLPDQYFRGWMLFVQLYELICREKLTHMEVESIGSISQALVLFIEDNFYQYTLQNVDVCKYVVHLLVHLQSNILDNGPLVACSQYWVERYIGYIVGRLNAKTLPSTSIYKAALFTEATKIIYNSPFEACISDNNRLNASTDYSFVGRPKLLTLYNASSTATVRRALQYYFIRKYPGLTESDCQELCRGIKSIKSFRGFKRHNDRDKGQYGCCATLGSFSSMELKDRPDYYVAVEMDVSADSAEIFYGRIRNILQVEIDLDDDAILNLPMNVNGIHDVLLMDWALNLEIGEGDQVQCYNARSGCFTSLSVEDLIIIRRKIGVFEYNVPTRFSIASTRSVLRSRRLTFFIDSCLRQDYLLYSAKENVLGRKLTLQGINSH